MLSAKTVAAVSVWATAGVVGTTLFLYASPMLEARLAPVLVDQFIETDETGRQPGRMCWTWKWTKAATPSPSSSPGRSQ